MKHPLAPTIGLAVLAGISLLNTASASVVIDSFTFEWSRRLGFDTDADNSALDNKDSGVITNSIAGGFTDSYSQNAVNMNAAVYAGIGGGGTPLVGDGGSYTTQVSVSSQATQTSGSFFPPGLHAGIYSVSSLSVVTNFTIDGSYDLTMIGFLGKNISTTTIQSISIGGSQSILLERTDLFETMYQLSFDPSAGTGSLPIDFSAQLETGTYRLTSIASLNEINQRFTNTYGYAEAGKTTYSVLEFNSIPETTTPVLAGIAAVILLSQRRRVER